MVLQIFFYSIVQALVSTMLSLLLALPVAHFFYLYDFPGKSFFISLSSMLCIMPTKLVIVCVTLFYGVMGFTGIILAHLMLNVPFTLYIITVAYQKVDTVLIWLAADSGASGWRCYKDIVFSLLRPTIISLFLLLFLLHFSSFSIPLLLGGALHYTPEIMIYTLYEEGNNIGAFLYWFVRLLVIIPFFFLHNRYAISPGTLGSVVQAARRKRYALSKDSIWWLIYCGTVAIMILGPIIALLVRACDTKVFAFFTAILSCMKDSVLGIAVYQVIINSILLAVVSGIGSVLIAFLLSVIESKVSSRMGRSFVSFCTIATFVIGTVGCGIVFAYLSYGKIISSFLIGVLCHVVLNYTFAYRIVRAQMILYHPDMHKSAQACGASFSKAIWTVSFPFVLPAMYRAFCVSFGLSLTEVGAGAVLQGTIGLTLPMAIRIYRKVGNTEAVIALSLLLLGLVFFVTYLFSYKE